MLGLLGLAAGAVAWSHVMQPVAGLFAALTLAMALGIAWPCLGAGRRSRRRRAGDADA